MYKSAITSPPRFQFEDNSGSLYASQSNNCGPTCITKIACFYNDNWYSIESTRRLVTSCCVPTNCIQQAQMLSARGVPASPVWIDHLSQMDEIIGTEGTRPITIGVLMSRVPPSVRDHDFLGWHAIAVLAKATRDGVKGYLVNDPNFSPIGGYRPDPDKGVKFYPEKVMIYAFLQNSPRWAIVPKNEKKTVPDNPPIYATGDPKMKFADELGHSVYVKAFKPMRAGATVSSRIVIREKEARKVRLLGRIKKEKLPKAEQVYGDVFIASIFDNGQRLVYIKQVDTRDYS